MANHQDTNKQMDRKKMEDQALYRMFWIFLAGIVGEGYVLFIRNKFMKGTITDVVAGGSVIPMTGYIGLAVLLIGLVLFAATRKKAEPYQKYLFAGLAAAGAFLGISSVVMWFLYETGASLLLVAIPALTVLGLIYYLYQKEFFTISVLYCLALFALWACRTGTLGIAATVIAIVVLVLQLLSVYGIFTLQKNGGSYKGKEIFAEGVSYPLLYGAAALAIVLVALGLVAAATAYYTVWVLGVVLFLLAVYYTSKLM